MTTKWKGAVLAIVLELMAAVAIQAQTEIIVLDDSLANRTLGKQTGGIFVAGGGWQVVEADNMIVYDLGEYVENGSVEVEIRNFEPQGQNSAKRHHFLAMFRNPWGTHHPAENLETVWDFHAGERYAPGIKALSWTYQEDESVTELPGSSWEANRTYHLRVVWNGNEFRYYRDGVLHASHVHSASMQLRYLFLGRDLTVSGDLRTDYKNNQYPALIGPIYANLVVKRLMRGDDVAAPMVSAVNPSTLYANAARLTWATDEPATCRVEYGLSPDFENATAVLGTPATLHETTLTGLASNQTYFFRIIARDKEGNAAVTENHFFTTTAGGKYLFKPVADTFVEADGIYNRRRSFGNFGWMHLLLSQGRECYLRFEVTGVSGKIVDAVLRLHGRQSGSGGEVGLLGSNWDELGVTWRKRPNVSGSKVGSLPAIRAGEWSEVSVISAVDRNATYNLAVTGASAETASLDSRESMSFQPELVLLTSCDDSTTRRSPTAFSIVENSTLRPGPPGSWDENIRERGWFMYENGAFHAWYGGWRGKYDHNVPGLVKLGYAFSTDGVNWMKHPGNPIYEQIWIEDVCVVKSDSTYYMYAEDEYTGNGENVHIVLYTSSDRINWTRHGTVLEKVGEGWESHEAATPTVWKEGNLWYMLYEGIGHSTAGQVGLATSSNGINWTRHSNNPVLANPFGTDRDLAIDSIIKVNGVYYAYGHYRDGSQKWVAGVFTSCNLTSWTVYPDNQIPCSSPVIVDNGSDYLLYGPDFSGHAPYKLSFANGAFSIVPAPNRALSFDGVNDYVEIPDSAMHSGGKEKSLTVEVWMNPAMVTGTQPIIQKFLNAQWKDWGLQIVDGVAEVAIESDGDNWTLRAGEIFAGEWTHVALAFDNGMDVVRLFVNGIEAGQKSLTKDMPDTEALIRVAGHGYANSSFNGTLDEIRIWSYARQAPAIAAEMAIELTGKEPGLIGYWPMNEGSGQQMNDLTGNGNTGRLGLDSAEDDADPAWIISTAPIGEARHSETPDSGNHQNLFASMLPQAYALKENYPNPFNPSTRIDFDLPEASTVRLGIYDMLGCEVVLLVNGERPAGRHSVTWSGRDAQGMPVGSGIYFYRLQIGSYTAVRKMLLVR